VVWRRDKDSPGWYFNQLVLKESADYFHQLILDDQENLKPYIAMPKLLRLWHQYSTSGVEKNAELIWYGVALAMRLRRQRSLDQTLI
jgi:hypothetical protein